MKSLLPALNRWMPAMMALFLLVMIIQAIVALNVTWGDIQHTLIRADPAYPVLAGLLILLVVCGYFYDRRTDRLLRRGIRRRKGFFMDVLARLTNRSALEDLMAREQRETVLDAEQLAASLRARVIGQDRVCEDISQQLRRRLALQVRGKPVGVFLLAGPPGTGKTYLAKQIARQTQRPLLHFDMAQMTHMSSETQMFGMSKGFIGSETYGKLTGGLKEKPDAVVLLDEIEKAHPDMLKKFLTAWNDGHVTEASNSEQISTSRAIFILTSNIATEALSDIAARLADDPDRQRGESVEALRQAGFAPEVLNRIDRIFVFHALEGLDLARVAALEIEAMIDGYGLSVEAGGIDAALLFQVMQRQSRLGTGASARDVVRSIEDMISESLIVARQQGARMVRVVSGPDGVITEIASDTTAQRDRMAR